MKILVTGGAGFIGSHLVDRLVKEGHEITVMDNLFRGNRQNLEPSIASGQVAFLNQDIRDFELVKQACRGCDLVYHLAAQSNVMGAVEDIRYSFSTNVVGTFNVLLAAKEQGVPRLVFSSSREAYGEAAYLPVDEKHLLNSKNSYGASKAAGEKYCQVFQNSGDLEVVILRLANVYGPRDFNRVIPIFLDNVQQGKELNVFGGEQLIDFIPLPFVIDVLRLAAKNRAALSGPVNVGSGRGTTLFELATRIMKISGQKSNVNVLPSRRAEVVKYTADLKRFKKVFQMEPPADPLAYLKEMIPF